MSSFLCVFDDANKLTRETCLDQSGIRSISRLDILAAQQTRLPFQLDSLIRGIRFPSEQLRFKSVRVVRYGI